MVLYFAACIKYSLNCSQSVKKKNLQLERRSKTVDGLRERAKAQKALDATGSIPDDTDDERDE